MASYQELKLKSGKIRIKAIARVWLNGIQKNRTKTFSKRSDAVEWAESIETEMRIDKVKKLYGDVPDPLAVLHHNPNMKVVFPKNKRSRSGSVSDLLSYYRKVIDTVERLLGQQNIITLNTSNLIEYFQQRHQEKAKQADIESEIQIIKELLANQKDSGTKRVNIVQMAYDVAVTDGAEFK